MKVSALQKSITDRIINSNKPVHIIASGAGTGKTTLIKYTIESFLLKQPHSRVLFLSFARKSIIEGTDRINHENVDFETSHSFSYKLLKQNSSKIIKAKYITHLGYINDYELPHKIGIIDDSFEDELLKNISSGKEDLIINHMDKCFRRLKWLTPSQVISPFVDNYITYKIENSLIDFNDMLGLARGLLLSNKQLAKELSFKYDLICVDESQDISDQQFDIIKFLFGKNKLVFVGDPCQLAYGFLGAQENFFQRVEDYFKRKNTAIYKLDVSYRCPQEICNLSNAITSQITFTHKTNLKQGIIRTTQLRPELVKYSGTFDGIDFVIRKIKKIIAKSNGPISVCILFRSIKGKNNKNQRQFTYLKKQLKKESISFYCKEKNDDVFKMGEVVISTIHSIKGGEAEYVFIVDVSSSNIPFKNLAAMPSLKYNNEELSLLNIAVTRAKKKLFLLNERSLVGRDNLSPFLKSIIENELVKIRTIS